MVVLNELLSMNQCDSGDCDVMRNVGIMVTMGERDGWCDVVGGISGEGPIEGRVTVQVTGMWCG